jgi:hypothetical protein
MIYLNRRRFGATAMAAFLYLLRSASRGQAASSADAFDRLLTDVGQRQQELADARAFRELDYRQDGPTESELAAAPNLPRRYKSGKLISARAKALIVQFEVSGKDRYIASYSKPVWPKGESGVTIGIGYDIGYSTPARLGLDWNGLLSMSVLSSLGPACGVKGAPAHELLPFLQDIDVPWEAATAQFDRFVPFVAGETAHAFPKCEQLTADSFGALTSLVYNRGGAMDSRPDDKLDRRKEMREIRDAIAAGALAEVPTQIRGMKRLWKDVPNARGLLDRRELEARLFEMGLT